MRDIAEIMGIFRGIRKAKNLSVANVADYIQREANNKVSPKTIYGWEEGNSKPDIMSFVAMCDLYEVQDIRELFTGDIQTMDIEMRDKLYKAYVANPDMQAATRILLGLE